MKVAKRRGAWVLDAYVHGQRVVKTYPTKRAAEDARAKLQTERRQTRHPACDPFITLRDYVPRFLEDCRRGEVVPATIERYERQLENHILPELGDVRVREITKHDVRELLDRKRREDVNLQGQKGDRVPRGSLARNTVNQIRSVLSGVLSLAVEEDILVANPASAPRGRRTKAARIRAKARTGDTVKALTLDQRNRFLAIAAAHSPECYPAFLLMALCGLRLGEALGLRWPSVDLVAKQITVREQLLSSTTKTGTSRVVDLADAVVETLRSLESERREQAFSEGREPSRWVVFPWLPEQPAAKDGQAAEKRIRRAMASALKRAGLPAHHTPHSLRHTFCTLLISAGVSPVYVQQQAGHANVNMTVSIYGSWFPVRAPGTMNRLAEGIPQHVESRPVTKTPQTGYITEMVDIHSLAFTGTYGAENVNRPSPA